MKIIEELYNEFICIEFKKNDLSKRSFRILIENNIDKICFLLNTSKKQYKFKLNGLGFKSLNELNFILNSYLSNFLELKGYYYPWYNFNLKIGDNHYFVLRTF